MRDSNFSYTVEKAEAETSVKDFLHHCIDVPKFLSYCQACACEVCLRSSGQPRAHPEQLRYSIEALGGDVGEAAQRYFGKPLLWVHHGEAPEYLMLVGGLLTR